MNARVQTISIAIALNPSKTKPTTAACFRNRAALPQRQQHRLPRRAGDEGKDIAGPRSTLIKR